MSLYGKIMKIQRICKEHLDCNKCPYYKVHELTGNEYCPLSSVFGFMPQRWNLEYFPEEFKE